MYRNHFTDENTNTTPEGEDTMMIPNANQNLWSSAANIQNPTNPSVGASNADFWQNQQPQYQGAPTQQQYQGAPTQQQYQGAPQYQQPQYQGAPTQPQYQQQSNPGYPPQPGTVAFTPDQATALANMIGSSATWLQPVMKKLLTPGGVNAILNTLNGVPGNTGVHMSTLSLNNTPKGNHDALMAILARSGQQISANVLNSADQVDERGFARLAAEFGGGAAGIDGSIVKGSLTPQELTLISQIMADYNRRLLLTPWDSLLIYALRTYNLLKFFIAKLSSATTPPAPGSDPVGKFSYGNMRSHDVIRQNYAFDSASDRTVFALMNALINAPEVSVSELVRNTLASHAETKGVSENFVAQQQFLINVAYRYVERFLYIKCSDVADYQNLQAGLLMLIRRLITKCGGLGHIISFTDVANTIIGPKNNVAGGGMASLEDAFRNLNDVPNPLSANIFGAFQAGGVPSVFDMPDPVASAAAAASAATSAKPSSPVPEPASLASVPTL